MRRYKAKKIVVVFTAGATSRSPGESYIVHFESVVPLRDLVDDAVGLMRATEPSDVAGTFGDPRRPASALMRGPAANSEKAKERAAKAAAKAERVAKREERAAAKIRRAEDRVAKARVRAEAQAAVEERRAKRTWIKEMPLVGDVVEYQEKPHGRWHVGKVVGLSAGHYKILGDRGTRFYPDAQVKRTLKPLRLV